MAGTTTNEARITINGFRLSEGQSMVVRVACASLYASMTHEDFPLGEDEHGRIMTEHYKDRMEEVLSLWLPQPVS
jgi:hypothetical protein